MKIIVLAVALFSVLGLQARSLVEDRIDSLISSSHVVQFDGVQAHHDSIIRQKIETFYYDQFRHSQDPDAPYFLFMSKDGALSMGIGGVVRMRAWYDWGGAIPVSAFTPMLIPMIHNPLAERQIGATPAGVCLYFRVLGRSNLIGDYQLYIEANFNGYQGRDFHLKQAYAKVHDFTIGYTSSTFSDPAALPPMVDAAGPNNKIDGTTVLVRYMPHITPNLIAAASLEIPNTQIAADGTTTAKCTSYLPDAAAFLQYEWSRGQHLRLAGIVRSLPYRDLVASQNHNLAGMGLSLSGVAHPLHWLTTYASINYGRGISSLGGDLLVGNYDLIANPDTSGRMYAPRSLGWCVGLQYNIRHNLFVGTMMSRMCLLPDYDISPDEYKYGLMGAVNIFWNPIPRLRLAAEFDLGYRHNFSGDNQSARRIGALCQFSF